MLRHGQIEESQSRCPPRDSKSAPPASCACDTDSEPRRVQDLTTEILLLHASSLAGLPAVSLEQAPRGENSAEPTSSPGQSYTLSPHLHVSNESEPFPTLIRRGSFTASEQSDTGFPDYSQRWSTNGPPPGASFDSNSTAGSSFVNIGSQYSQHRTPGELTPQSELFDHDYDLGHAAQSINSPQYARELNLSPTSTRSPGASHDGTQRVYTSSLSLPVVERGLSGASTVVSDAGREEKIRQNAVTDPSNSSSWFDSQEGLEASSPVETQGQLQDQILDALEHSKKSQGQNEFLPAMELQRLVGLRTVAAELKKAIGENHDEEDIKRFTVEICSPVKAERSDGKAKTRLFLHVFALLVIIGATPSIRLFIKENVSDIDLPLVWSDSTKKELCRSNNAGDSVGEPLKCFGKLSRVQRRNFFDYQWKLLAPFFSKGSGQGEVKHYLLRDEHILPFLDCTDVLEEDSDKVGGYGKVSMVQIHPDHHNFDDEGLGSRGFAIKQQVYDCDTAVFQTEIDILKKFSGGRGHPHIVSLLATFEQFKKLHLIFHRAQGDLFAFWSDSQEAPTCDHDNVKWLAEQCKGLADGLLRLHRHLTFTQYQSDREAPIPPASLEPPRPQLPLSDTGKHVSFHHTQKTTESLFEATLDGPFEPKLNKNDTRDLSNFSDGKYVKRYGRHGDLHPGNILWYGKDTDVSSGLRGTLKLADFGQAELNSLKSRTRPRTVANTITYRPPESDRGLDRTQPLIRQTYDMWCLGCVYLELLTWFLGGDETLQHFVRLRLTSDYFENNMMSDNFFQVTVNSRKGTYEVVVKDKVIQFIDSLHKHPCCTDYCHDLLNVIQHDMLVIDSNGRKSCEEVWRKLNDMYKRCSFAEYASKATPWRFKRSSMSHPVVFKVKEELARVSPASLKTSSHGHGKATVQKEKGAREEQSEPTGHTPHQPASPKPRRKGRRKSAITPNTSFSGSFCRR